MNGRPSNNSMQRTALHAAADAERWADENMRIDPLGELIPDKEFADWLVSAPIPIPFFEGVELRFTLEGMAGDPAPDDFVAAVSSFLAFDLRDRERAAPHVWSSVHPTEVRVSRRHRRDKKVYVQVSADGDWEPEHGLQLVYRDGVLRSRVSNQDGHLTHTDAFDLPEEEDRIQ